MIKNRQLYVNANLMITYTRAAYNDWKHVMINLLAVSIDFQTETVNRLN